MIMHSYYAVSNRCLYTTVFGVLALISIAHPAHGQSAEIAVSNLQIFGQDHGFPYGLWTDQTLAEYLQTFDDFDGNGVDDLLIDEFGYTIVLLNSDGTVLRMLPGHEDIESVVGPGDINKDGIPDIAYLKDGKVYIGFLNEEGWISEEKILGLAQSGAGIGAGFYPDKVYRVGDVNGDGARDVGVSLQSDASSDPRDRRFGIVYVDLNANQLRKGDQFVDWSKGNWETGDPSSGKRIDLAVSVADLQEPVDGIDDFILLSLNQNDEVVTHYIDFNADGSANHWLASEPLGDYSYFRSVHDPRVFDEHNPPSGDFRFRCVCFGNTLIDLDEVDKEVVGSVQQEAMAVESYGSGDVAQIGDLSGDGIRDYVSGKSSTFYDDGAYAYIQMWSENSGRGPIVNSFQNGGWKILRPGDQYGAAISVVPWSTISNSANVYQLIGVRAREDGRGSYMWHHNWYDSGVIGGIGTFYIAETSHYSLESRDLFGTATDALWGYIGAPGRDDDTGSIFKIPGVEPFAFNAARYLDPNGTFEVNLGGDLLAKLRSGDEFGTSLDGIDEGGNPYHVAVGAIEKNAPGGKNTGAVYLLEVEGSTVVNHWEIGRDTPVLGPMLDDIDHFGSAVAYIGDLDQNGFQELAVGARVDDDGGHDRGAVYILFMEAGANIDKIQKISSTQGGFTGILPNSSFFGEAVARLGDVNGDEIPDIAVGAPRMGNGAVWILTLNANGTVKTTTLIDDDIEGIEYDAGALFGGAIDANVCFPEIPDSDISCRESPQLWISARGNREHRGTIWALDFELLFDDPIPVELTRFSGLTDGSSVFLSWHVASEINNAGFQIERSVSAMDGFERIGFVEGRGTAGAAEYTFTDPDPPVGQPLYYRLKQIDFDGAFEYSDIVEIEAITPAKVELYSNYPNPFNPSTLISFDLPRGSDVSLRVYDLTGRTVDTLIKGFLPAGRHNVEFNGAGYASGFYVYRLVAAHDVLTRKMMLVQ